MKGIFKWALAIAVIIVAYAFIAPKKSPPLMWVEKTNIVQGQEQTSTAFVTLKRDRVDVAKGEPTFTITSRSSDFLFNNLLRTTKVKVYCYDKDGNTAIEEAYTLKESGDPRKGEFTSKKVADFLWNNKGKVRLCAETKDGSLDLNIPTWASRRPIRAPSERKVKENTTKIKEKAKEIANDIRADS